MIIGIDPGHKQSAYVVWDKEKIYGKGIMPNLDFLETLRTGSWRDIRPLTPVIEMIASYGMPDGKEIFETVLMIGRMVEIFDCEYGNYNLVYRKEIKLHFCGTNRAKDSNIRQVLIDRFGVPGTKKDPGILYGVSKDIWAALAVAVYWQEVTDIPPK